MKIEIWSDIVCPWCYIGKRRIEAAIKQWDKPVEVVWRSFQLDPTAPNSSDVSMLDSLTAKYRIPRSQAQSMMQRVVDVAATEGLRFNFDIASSGNTFDAHRLLHLAKSHGMMAALKEQLMERYFTYGLRVSDHEQLAAVAIEVGLDAEEVADVLGSTRFADDVQRDIDAARANGTTGVPFFVFDNSFGVSGAQEVDTLLQVMRQVEAARHIAQVDDSLSCDDTGCDVPDAKGLA